MHEICGTQISFILVRMSIPEIKRVYTVEEQLAWTRLEDASRRRDLFSAVLYGEELIHLYRKKWLEENVPMIRY